MDSCQQSVKSIQEEKKNVLHSATMKEVGDLESALISDMEIQSLELFRLALV